MKAIRIVLALLIFAAAFPMVSEARMTSCSIQDHDPSPIGGGGSSGGGGC